MTYEAAFVEGTSAQLVPNDTLTVWELLHGLMLPSGNDAAFALAEFFGRLLIENGKEEKKVGQNRRNIFIARNS